jgi:hypothetical protein
MSYLDYMNLFSIPINEGSKFNLDVLSYRNGYFPIPETLNILTYSPSIFNNTDATTTSAHSGVNVIANIIF